MTIIAILWSLLYYGDLCRTKNVFRRVFIKNSAFLKEVVWRQESYAKVPYITKSYCTVTQIKKTTEGWSLQHEKSWSCRISLNEPSRIIQFQIRISWKKSKENKVALFWFNAFLEGTSSKIEKDGKLVRKRCQNFTSRVLSRWLSEDITYSGLLINKK